MLGTQQDTLQNLRVKAKFCWFSRRTYAHCWICIRSPPHCTIGYLLCTGLCTLFFLALNWFIVVDTIVIIDWDFYRNQIYNKKLRRRYIVVNEDEEEPEIYLLVCVLSYY